jgi:hypothetical protein
MPATKLFKNGNSQAVRIPAEMAYSNWDIELVIEREGDELRCRKSVRHDPVMMDLARRGRWRSDISSLWIPTCSGRRSSIIRTLTAIRSRDVA